MERERERETELERDIYGETKNAALQRVHVCVSCGLAWRMLSSTAVPVVWMECVDSGNFVYLATSVDRIRCASSCVRCPHLRRWCSREREFVIRNLLIRNYSIIEMRTVDRPCAMGVSIFFSRWRSTSARTRSGCTTIESASLCVKCLHVYRWRVRIRSDTIEFSRVRCLHFDRWR